jgi:hypothetical protein
MYLAIQVNKLVVLVVTTLSLMKKETLQRDTSTTFSKAMSSLVTDSQSSQRVTLYSMLCTTAWS